MEVRALDLAFQFTPQIVDVINLQLISGEHFSYLAVARLAQKKKVVLIQQDNWNFTGYCVYSFERMRWKTIVAIANTPRRSFASQRGGTAQEWKLKKWEFSRKNVSVRNQQLDRGDA